MSNKNNQDEAKKGKGFSGLSSMVTDVSSVGQTENDASASSKRAAEIPNVAPEQVTNEAVPESRGAEATYAPPYKQSKKPLSSQTKWLIGAAILIGLIWLFNSGGKSNPAQQTYKEDVPPVGTGLVLTTPQVRYCVFENIRLDALNQVVNPYNHAQVDLYNTLINDYNSRCSNYRYRSGVLESVKREAETRRFILEMDGKTFFDAPVRKPSPSSQTSAPPPVAAAQAPPVAAAQVPETAKQAVAKSQQNTSASTQSRQDAKSSTNREPTYAERESIEAACSTDKYLNGPAAYNSCVKRHTASLGSTPPAPDLSTLSYNERESIESACNTEKYVNGPAEYNKCLNRKYNSLKKGNARPDLSALTYDERESIESSCSVAKYVNGPADYNNCLRVKLSALQKQKGRIDLSKLSYKERERVENICSVDKYSNGPAAYNQCIRNNVRQ